MSRSRPLVLLIVVLFVASISQAQTESSRAVTFDAVHVKLVLAESKTTFRIGEPIKLVMEFTADAPGYTVDIIEDRGQPTSDTVLISPDSGVTHWAEEMSHGLRYPRDVFSMQNLSTTPVSVGLTLNHTLRFDRSGHYTVKVRTVRVSTGDIKHPKPLTFTTNEVSFDVEPMSEEQEQAEIKRVSTALEGRRDWQSEENLAQQMSFLTGDLSTREKVRRFLNPEQRSGNYSAHISYGLFIAKNRALVLQLLEAALRDSNQPVSSSLLGATSSIRYLKDNNGAPADPKPAGAMLTPDTNPRMIAIENGYLTELALGLSKRTGKSLTTTAMTILTSSKKTDPNRAATIGEARRVLIQQFGSLHPYDQEALLRGYWDELRDPSLIGPLKQMLSYNATASKNVHDAALKRLIEMSPDESRKYIVKEICDQTSLVDIEILGQLSEKSLPEVDTCLIEQLKRFANVAQLRIFLEHKTSLAVRFASENIYQDVMQLYRDARTKLPLEVRAGLLAYLAKQNEGDAIPLIEEEVASLSVNEDFNFLPKLTKLYYSEAIGEVVKKRLESDEPQAASNAAYLLGLHGSADDVAVLQARLERWRKDWGERVSEADRNLQGTVERELIYALLHGKAWKLSDGRKKELQQSCVTKMCKQSNRVD